MTASIHQAGTPVPEGHVRLTIDGIELDAPQDELVIRACERLGIVVPRFCDHPLLDPAGACRQCLVEVEMGGRPMPKPQASCTITVADGMVVRTQHTSEVADKAQQGVMELLLINHPLDCPVCDKGGECPLQNQAMSNGRAESRFVDVKRTFAKPIPITPQILLDRERCVLCQRCTRFDAQIAGDYFIDLLERGSVQQIGTPQTAELPGATGSHCGQSYFSGNTIQICPVGALTSASYRFRSRPFDLVSSPGVCEHCASGCALRTDWRRGAVQRRLAAPDPAVNEEWNCDKGRFAFRYATTERRLLRPLMRDGSGELVASSWTDALRAAAEGLTKARDAGGAAVLAGGRLTVEDAYAYGKFARLALHTNDVDFRGRPHSEEELEFLAAAVVGRGPEQLGYHDLEAAPAVLCVAFEPEEESPIVYLRLRKAAREGLRVFLLGQWTTPALRRTSGRLVPALPGQEAAVLGALQEVDSEVDAALAAPGAVVLVGERAAEVPGLYSAVSALAERTGARIGWVPRRAGERGALDAGAAPTLLPGGRLVADHAARAELERAWGLDAGALPELPGRDTDRILAAAAAGKLGGLLVGGLELEDLPDPVLAREALRRVPFVVSLELRRSSVTELADVVLPVAPAVEKAGSYLDWEGRRREFATTIESTTATLPDCRVLDTLAVEMDVGPGETCSQARAIGLGTQTPAAAAGELDRLGAASGARPAAPTLAPPRAARPGPYQALLATWRQLIDGGALLDGEPHLAATARPARLRVNAATAAKLGLRNGGLGVVSSERGQIRLPVEVADLPDGVVWVPVNSPGGSVRELGLGHGDAVRVGGGA